MNELGIQGFEAVHFIRPWWLAALPLAVLLPWWWRRSRRPSGDWEKICDPHLLRWLSQQPATAGKRSRGHWLAGLGLLIAILALAGPSWQQLPDTAFAAREARVIVFDLSSSMLAGDLRPDRLTRARFRLDDLLQETREGQTGLVAFAGDAFVVSPLTNDTNTIANLLPALRPDVIPVGGSRADRALDLAAELLQRAGFARGEILLVTDSADPADAAKARELHDQGIITSVMAVGTVEGAPIPSGGGFVSDRSGNVVIARLNPTALREVVSAGGGRYTELGALSAATEHPWAVTEGSEFTRRDDSLDRRWKDSGPWLVLLLLPLALFSFRRGLVFMLPLLAIGSLLQPATAHAGWWEDLWQRKDQQAYQALQNEQAERAAALARDPAISGEAWYRSGNFENALGAWSQLDSADALYNRGNALTQQGQYDAAIDAYDQALTLRPEMEDAEVNRSIAERLKEQQEQQQQQQEEQDQDGQSQDGESSDEASDSQSSEDQQGEEGEEGDPSEQQGEQEQQGEGEQGERSDEETDYTQAWSEEDAQAMEQWLRRIPDDPGGLLRRKFMYEHQRRGAPEEESEPW